MPSIDTIPKSWWIVVVPNLCGWLTSKNGITSEIEAQMARTCEDGEGHVAIDGVNVYSQRANVRARVCVCLCVCLYCAEKITK